MKGLLKVWEAEARLRVCVGEMGMSNVAPGAAAGGRRQHVAAKWLLLNTSLVAFVRDAALVANKISGHICFFLFFSFPLLFRLFLVFLI